MNDRGLRTGSNVILSEGLLLGLVLGAATVFESSENAGLGYGHLKLSVELCTFEVLG